MLPDWQFLLGRVDQIGAGGEGSATVGCTHGGDESRVTDGQGPDTVHDGERDDVVAGSDLACHVSEDVTGAGMALVVEAGHASAVIMVPDVSGEGHDCTSSGGGDEIRRLSNADGVVGDPAVCRHSMRVSRRFGRHRFIMGDPRAVSQR